MFGRFLELGIATPDIAASVDFYERLGFSQLITGEGLHQLQLRDPAGHAVRLLESRTYSPASAGAGAQSSCGYFVHLSLPQGDFERACEFWERGGFVALPELDEPYPHLPLTSDHLDLAFHQRRTFDAPLLVFECADLPLLLHGWRRLGLPLSQDLPRGFDRRRNALIEAPEGTALLVLQAPG